MRFKKLDQWIFENAGRVYCIYEKKGVKYTLDFLYKKKGINFSSEET